MNSTPVLGRITRHNGVAGQFSYSLDVTYPDEPTERIEFVGSVYGGPVVMVTPHGQTFVTAPSRFGKFNPHWVRQFFGVSSVEYADAKAPRGVVYYANCKPR